MAIFKFSVNGFNLFKLYIHFCLWNGQQENARTSVKSGNTAIFIPHAYQTRAVTHQRLIFESCTLKAMSLCYLILTYLLYQSKQRNPQFLRYLSHYTPSSNQNISIFGSRRRAYPQEQTWPLADTPPHYSSSWSSLTIMFQLQWCLCFSD